MFGHILKVKNMCVKEKERPRHSFFTNLNLSSADLSTFLSECPCFWCNVNS